MPSQRASAATPSPRNAIRIHGQNGPRLRQAWRDGPLAASGLVRRVAESSLRVCSYCMRGIEQYKTVCCGRIGPPWEPRITDNSPWPLQERDFVRNHNTASGRHGANFSGDSSSCGWWAGVRWNRACPTLHHAFAVLFPSSTSLAAAPICAKRSSNSLASTAEKATRMSRSPSAITPTPYFSSRCLR